MAQIPLRRSFPSLSARIRRRIGSVLVDSGFRGLAHFGRWIPGAQPRYHGVEVLKDIPYVDGAGREHHLDVWRPRQRSGVLPAVLYIHGGGFRILSKESHWLMALIFARRGYVVFTINYRLAPRHPFPAAHEDAAQAYAWVVKNAERFGADPRQLILAGESAGANLVTSLAISATYRRPEPYARTVFETGVVPRAVLPACGILQVSDCARFVRKGRVSWFVADRLMEVADAYLERVALEEGAGEMADPVVILEKGQPPDRPLPPFFAPCGGADPLKEDTLRLKAALDRLGVPCEAPLYPGGLHAFHGFIWEERARKCWRDQLAFVKGLLERVEDVALPEQAAVHAAAPLP